MPASVLAERVGWEGSPSWFRKQVSKVRPETGPVDPADRLNCQAPGLVEARLDPFHLFVGG
jgi:hypothetical protein